MGKIISVCRRHKKIALAIMESQQGDLGLGLDYRIERVLNAYPETACELCSSPLLQ